MSDPAYVPPITSETAATGDKAPAPKAQETKPTAPASTATSEDTAKPAPLKEPTYEEPASVIGVGKLTNVKGTVLTDLLIERIDRHIQFLTDAKAYGTQKEKDDEQTTFIETMGNIIKAEYNDYELVTNHLLKVIRENSAVFADGRAFRFVQNIANQYPADIIRAYKAYMLYLAKLAINWPTRHRLKSMIDIATVVSDVPKKGKQNVMQYFNKVTND